VTVVEKRPRQQMGKTQQTNRTTAGKHQDHAKDTREKTCTVSEKHTWP